MARQRDRTLAAGQPREKRDAAHAAAPRRVPVLLPLPLSGAYDYTLPEGMEVAPGAVVFVPLGTRRLPGVVWHDAASGAVAESKLRPIAAVAGVPPLGAALLRFIAWVASYTLAPPGEVLRLALPEAALAPPPPPRLGWRAASSRPQGARITPSRARVLAVLERSGGLAWTASDLARAAGVGAGVVRAMGEAGLLEAAPLPEPRVSPAPSPPSRPLKEAQVQAAEALRGRVAKRSFSVTVLDGVTGSGKTEVYLEAAAEAVARGRQVLVLLPEIALSAQVIDRFAARFGAAPAVWHSDVPQARRRATWRAVADGTAPVVVGARSALWLNFRDLGLIIVDEEHETAFKQEEGVIYHARDMAVVRARLENVPCVLVSATPSLETRANVERGRYRRLHLPDRHGAAGEPVVEAVDLRRHPPPRGGFLSPRLREAVAETLARGEQTLLFLNRRGFAPLTLCRACGHRFSCPNCTAWLVEHRYTRSLQCHHCGHTEPVPPICPACGAEGALTAVGPGVERIAEEVRLLFPTARVLEMSSDTVQGARTAAAMAARIAAREVDLIVGTQLVAKGWHFPHLTLVGVIDADLGLAGGDLRAAERTFQILHQVGGRAGRAERPGRVLLQTWCPQHPVMRALVSGEIERFVLAELAERRAGGWPPYGRLAALIVSAGDAETADEAAQALRRAAPEGDRFLVLGPAPAPLAVLRGQHRRRLLLKAARDANVPTLLRGWLASAKVPRAARVEVDVDPVSFL